MGASELGKERDIEREVQRVLEGLAVALGDIEDIAVGLEGEEGDPDGEHDRPPAFGFSRFGHRDAGVAELVATPLIWSTKKLAYLNQPRSRC